MPMRALVVDDDKAHLTLLKTFLKKLQFEGETASNGQEAVDAAKKGHFDICFMDIQMPVMNGIEAAKIIKSEISKDLPIIATTTLSDFNYDRSIAEGLDDYLKKPVDFAALKTIIAKHCG